MPKNKKQINYTPFIIVLLIIFVLYYMLQNSSFGNSSFTGEAVKRGIIKGIGSCTETDSGDDPRTFGTLSYTSPYGFNIVRQDFCNTANNLTEYYCNKNKLQIHPYTCPCSNGACL